MAALRATGAVFTNMTYVLNVKEVLSDADNTFMNVLTILEPNVTVVRTCTSTASVTDSLANFLFECLGFRGALEAFTQ